MKNTVKIALGAMCIALSAAVMMSASIIPFMTYSVPALVGMFILFIRIECSNKWAFAVYFCTSVVCALVVPEKECVGIYISLLGYYPILKVALDKLQKWLSVIIKSVFFVVVIIASYTVMMKFFGISDDLLEESGKYMIPVLVILGLIAFLLYDYMLTVFDLAYRRKWQKKIHKILRIK
ncbi:MAG: hypothetical protein PUB20_00500 [Clostridia bacterium]|nr:hypothetical protein [Clostridia bacterium]